ncbi:MAG: PilT/PilU family type 4a pilus ATPase [Patescibacteria group bacterium]|jgi:twitching motility protein PilT
MNINKIFRTAIEKRASDVHLVHGLPPVLRIDGKLFILDSSSFEVTPLLSGQEKFVDPSEDLEKEEKNDDNLSPEKYTFSDDGELVQKNTLSPKISNSKIVTSEIIKKLIVGILSKEQLDRFKEEKDCDFSYQFGKFRFRVNVSYEKENIKLVARIIGDKQPTLEEIDMPKQIYNLLNLKQGLILITGPTGCGKSTSLAAMINYINEVRSCNIITLEDPIEFIFKPNKSIITQRQLGTDMPTFASGLKHILRQDPNVIMVGEMRDLETISTAITLAETGHLVLATLHTCNASQTIDRIIDIFPPYQQNQIKSQLSMILSAVISQTLISRKGGGQIAVREILINNPAVSNLIREQKIAQIKSIIETHSKVGMISFERSIKDLYERGLVEADEANSFLNNKLLV